jgi:hypothetical protein
MQDIGSARSNASPATRVLLHRAEFSEIEWAVLDRRYGATSGAGEAPWSEVAGALDLPIWRACQIKSDALDRVGIVDLDCEIEAFAPARLVRRRRCHAKHGHAA